jgi:hypothetical protein
MTLSAEDSLEILQLVARVDACATLRDADGYAALFTDDATMDGDMGQAGAQDLGETVSRVWAAEPPGTLHLTLNAVIEESGRCARRCAGRPWDGGWPQGRSASSRRWSSWSAPVSGSSLGR